MANLLYLVHRMPYPPNKGDKVRSYHLLRHLASKHRVFLGTFVDDPDDEQHIESLRAICADVQVVRLDRRKAQVRSLAGLLRGEALTLPYYRDAGLQRWVDETCRREGITSAVVFSSAMAQYVGRNDGMPVLVDFVDVDSAKWTQYADRHCWPMSWVYRREGRTLLDFERRVAGWAARSYFSTENEAVLFRQLAPECSARAEAMCNGVDADYFSPDPRLPSPYGPGALPIVFTGAMDYWPNVDAAIWFAAEVLPAMKERWPESRFWVVGRNPTPAVQALASSDVVVTGTVPDVRPYLQHAAVVVAPLRVARGIQNKVLEAMAMGRPVVASVACSGGVDAAAGSDFLVAETPMEFCCQIGSIIEAADRGASIGRAGRARVVERYSWEANMSIIDCHIEMAPSLRAGA